MKLQTSVQSNLVSIAVIVFDCFAEITIFITLRHLIWTKDLKEAIKANKRKKLIFGRFKFNLGFIFRCVIKYHGFVVSLRRLPCTIYMQLYIPNTDFLSCLLVLVHEQTDTD